MGDTQEGLSWGTQRRSSRGHRRDYVGGYTGGNILGDKVIQGYHRRASRGSQRSLKEPLEVISRGYIRSSGGQKEVINGCIGNNLESQIF